MHRKERPELGKLSELVFTSVCKECKEQTGNHYSRILSVSSPNEKVCSPLSAQGIYCGLQEVPIPCFV